MATGKGTRSSVNRRSVLKGAAGLSAAAALGGRGLRSTGAQEFSGKLTVWGVVSFTEAGDELLGQQMVEWGEANGVEVEYVPLPGSDYTTKVATAVEAGSVPDVVMMIGDLTLFYADQDRLVDLTDVFDGLKTLGGGMWKRPFYLMFKPMALSTRFRCRPMSASCTPGSTSVNRQLVPARRPRRSTSSRQSRSR